MDASRLTAPVDWDSRVGKAIKHLVAYYRTGHLGSLRTAKDLIADEYHDAEQLCRRPKGKPHGGSPA